MHALLALEKFSKTGADNARRVTEVTITPPVCARLFSSQKYSRRA
jgi:hypothetical protein